MALLKIGRRRDAWEPSRLFTDRVSTLAGVAENYKTHDSWAPKQFKAIPLGVTRLVPSLLCFRPSALCRCLEKVTMSLSAAKMRIPGAAKGNKAIPFTRARSTAATGTSTSMLDAKSRVREHVRNISQTTARDASAAQTV